jgi:hypothetical protein
MPSGKAIGRDGKDMTALIEILQTSPSQNMENKRLYTDPCLTTMSVSGRKQRGNAGERTNRDT